jgi:DNA polymerase III epsilon subunit-like protein
MNYIFFDIECANCFQGKGKICSFGYVITNERFRVLEKRDIVINPRSKFHLAGRGNHPGIVLAYDEAEFKSAPLFSAYYEEIRELLQDENNIVFGFSVMSDAGFIKSECERYKKEVFDYSFIDVQRIYTDMHSLTNTPGLIKCASEYGVKESQEIHKSDDDAFFTMRVMKGLCKESRLSPLELIEKYPNCKCWCKNGELDNEFIKFKAIQKANKLSKMEKLTGSKRSNWMYSRSENHSEFVKYASGVFVHYSSPSPLSGKRICFSNLYEEFHFSEMMNIVSELAKHGVRYTHKPYTCDIFVTYSLKNKNDEEYECFRLNKALKCAESGERSIEFISIDELIEMLNLNKDEIATLDRSKLSALWKKTPANV